MTGPSFDGAFRRLYEERAPALYRYLGALCRDAAQAQDLIQESFLKLYRRGAMPDDPSAWLVSVAHNLLRDEGRRAFRRRTLISTFPADVPVPAAAEPADAAALANERIRGVRLILDRLPERDRQLLLMRHASYSYHEIAEVIGVAPASVGTLLIRATDAFRSAWEEKHGASD
jgi:RNA polymerase sigma-70 factor (ECF subfamily)